MCLPSLSFASIASAASENASAIIAFNTMFGSATLQDEATILNSKRFPVNANGDVRLRSVGSLSTAGHSFTPRSSIPAGIDESAYPFSMI